MNTSNIQIMGVTDETNTCECCGKTNLKRVVVLKLENGDIVRYGRDCAARAYGKQFGKRVDAVIEAGQTTQTIMGLIAKWDGKFPDSQIINHIHVKYGVIVEKKNGQWAV